MGSNTRDKSLRGGRKARRAAKHPPDSTAAVDAPAPAPPSFPASPTASPADPDPAFGIPNPSPLSAGYDDAGWGYCTEEQLEELLLKNLDFVYKEALARLVSLGYDEDAALRAVLCSGHCYGSMDVLSNILHNAIAHLNAPPSTDSPPPPAVPATPNVFTDLRHLQEYSLAGMVCLLQQVRPTLTRGDAMWCLLMSDLHVGRARTIEIPALPPSATIYPTPNVGPPAPPGAAPATGAGEFTPAVNLCNFHATAAVGPTVGVGDVADHRRYDLPPSMKSALRRNASMFPPGSGFRPFIKPSVCQESSDLASEKLKLKEDGAVAANHRVENDPLDSGVVDSVLKALEGMSLEDNSTEDWNKEMILDVIRQIRELEAQVKERKEWAQQKALQAARKLSNDLTELRMLRMEREENQRLKKGKQALEDTTMKRLTDMENALKKVSGQVDRANAVVRRLETENAEIRAEIEASKLSASESARTCSEVARREKKYLKKLMVWEKQREKMQEEVVEEKKKIVQMQQQLDEVKVETKEYEVKWKQEIKAKEEAISLADEERRAKDSAKVNASRRQEALRRKIEIDFQRHKDDIQRLEDELARLKSSAGSNPLFAPSANTLKTTDADVKSLKEPNVKALTGFNKPQDSTKKLSWNRVCVICKKDEVSIVFLPCSHQVVCASCNEDHDKKGKVSCPSCNVRIEERIRVYGASS
ncbi:MND1-interacting protein 1 [Canna indica]|uniref:MND1-interacting protein 1 n=1 Tax=Canna indica TaxID=4628 RepID=A0AAQ3JUA5_9LILI|nr:MND1-interacting protein 1 [Canna indica]